MKNINVAIIGSGTMGMGIAQLSATMGNKTYLYDIEQNALEKAEEFINKMLQKLVDKNKLTEHQYKSISEKINYTSELNDIADAEMVIEAIVEDPDVKKKVFSDIEKNCII
jgi:3-hydroxybutyryl-CoA dehydrogenase